MVYLKNSFIVRSFHFLFIRNMAQLQELVTITTGVRVENLQVEKCLLSQKPRVLISTLTSFELFDVLPCSSSPDNGVCLGSISVSLHTSDIIFAVSSCKPLCGVYKAIFLATHTVLNIKFTY